MYRLIFLKSRSKHFQEALDQALELGATFNGNEVILEIEEENLLNAYATMRTLFSFVQNWRGTRAEYRGIKVHPYQFILQAHQIRECAGESFRDISKCRLVDGTEAWGCKKLNAISYTQDGNGIYKNNKKHWYNFGRFEGEKWVIDKNAIRERLLEQADEKALHLCPFFDQIKLIINIDNLPDYIIPDDRAYEVYYIEKYVDGVMIQVPNNIRHISYRTFSRGAILGMVKI